MRRRPRPKPFERSNSDEPRVNRQIRVPRVLLIDEEGRRLGEFLVEDALALAQDRALDLVEVQPNARPPVCRIIDYGRFKYEKKKQTQESRRKQVIVQIKEVKLRPKTDTHDLDVKLRMARKFLEAGQKVKVTVRFRGREMAHKEIGHDHCLEFYEALKDLCSVETPPRMEGRQMFMILASNRKPKRPSKTSREPREDGSDDGEE